MTNDIKIHRNLMPLYNLHIYYLKQMTHEQHSNYCGIIKFINRTVKKKDINNNQ